MNRKILILLSLCAVACAKENGNRRAGGAWQEDGKEICFVIKGMDPYTESKVTEVTRENLASFYLKATAGSAGSETERWSVTATKQSSSGEFVTGKYWPFADPSYHFYASNAALTTSAAGTSVTVDGSSDVICACLYDPEFNATNSITFSHIMARIGSVEVTSANGYAVAVASVKVLQANTSGTFNLRTSSWSGLGGAASAALSEGENDYLIVPGTYTMEVRYTLSKGDYSGTFTSSGDVVFAGGKISNVRINLSADPAIAVNFAISVVDWESKTVGLTLG